MEVSGALWMGQDAAGQAAPPLSTHQLSTDFTLRPFPYTLQVQAFPHSSQTHFPVPTMTAVQLLHLSHSGCVAPADTAQRSQRCPHPPACPEMQCPLEQWGHTVSHQPGGSAWSEMHSEGILKKQALGFAAAGTPLLIPPLSPGAGGPREKDHGTLLCNVRNVFVGSRERAPCLLQAEAAAPVAGGCSRYIFNQC